MKEISIPIHCLKEMKEGLRLAANILESRKRETAADRQIDFAERIAEWLLNGRNGDMPHWIPDRTLMHLPSIEIKLVEHNSFDGSKKEIK